MNCLGIDKIVVDEALPDGVWYVASLRPSTVMVSTETMRAFVEDVIRWCDRERDVVQSREPKED